jgi:hypothetical protein
MTESPKDLAKEAQSGRSERTPAIALTAVHMAVFGFAGLVIAICLILYYVL